MPNISGVDLFYTHAGFKYKTRPDLLCAVFSKETRAAGVFTTSSAAAAPVIWSRSALTGTSHCRALIVTAGNANAFTGREGLAHVRDMAQGLAKRFECAADNILIAQTGVIGQPFPVTVFHQACPSLFNLGPDAADKMDWEGAARTIMTTDTFPKAASRTINIGGVVVTLAGIAKGSGMIEPDMATMLAFVMTDADIDAALLADLLRDVNTQSFNAITVDGDTSTNDCLLVFATGAAGNAVMRAPCDPGTDAFRTALLEVCQDLARQIVRDGEGASKFVTVTVRGARDDRSAQVIAKSIANSPLVKTAIAGGDANWGRLVMAVGKSGEDVAIDKLSIWFGPHLVAEHGAVSPTYSEEVGTAYFAGQELHLAVDVGLAHGQADVWTCDLTHGYIDINADYRS